MPTPNWLLALRRSAPEHGPLLVAFSGGLDSSVLLHALAADHCARVRGLRAVHIDHGLHSDSADWARHCRSLCAELGIELSVRRVQVGQTGLGPEADARHARYAAFASELRAGETLVLAQHRDDQAETVLLRMLRGSASRGLAAMASARALGSQQLWRPLLDVSRSQLLAYAEDQGLRWLDDPSNSQLRFDRNFLRHQLLPLLRQRWPHADAAMAHSARWLAEDAELLDQECAKHLAKVRGANPATLSVTGLNELAPAWRSRLLRYWLADLGLPPISASGVAAVLGPVLAARTDAVPEYVWPGGVLRRWQGLLWAEPEQPGRSQDWQRDWDGLTPACLPDSQRFVLQRSDAATPLKLRIAFRCGGERIRLPRRSQRSELKTVLQTLAVPPWQRARLPLLFDDDGELLAVGELVMSQRMVERGWQFRRLSCLTADQLAN